MNFSVLMSVYGKDDPTFFKQALESVTVNQALKPNQVVIILDGPVPDDIRHAIKLLSEDNTDIEFSVVEKEKNAGLAAALNSGLAVCKYEWVARMDSDDISVADRFEKQLTFLMKHPEVSLLGGAIAEFNSTPGDIQSERHVGLTHSDILKMAKKRTPFNHVSVIYKKDAVVKVGGYSEDFGKLEDYKLWVDLLADGNVGANIDDVIVNVRVGNGFLGRRSNKREITDWDELQSYLYRFRMVTKTEAFKNKVAIRVFTYMPTWAKKAVYITLLRK